MPSRQDLSFTDFAGLQHEHARRPAPVDGLAILQRETKRHLEVQAVRRAAAPGTDTFPAPIDMLSPQPPKESAFGVALLIGIASLMFWCVWAMVEAFGPLL